MKSAPHGREAKVRRTAGCSAGALGPPDVGAGRSVVPATRLPAPTLGAAAEHLLDRLDPGAAGQPSITRLEVTQ